MKKIISLIVICVLLITGTSAYAEGEQKFTLRNGITWGMSRDEIKAIEGEDAVELEQENGLILLGYEGKKFSKYTGDFANIFANDKLFLCFYTLKEDEQAFDYLSRALASKYGESHSVDRTIINTFMSNIYNGDYTADLSDGQGWTVSDTNIWLFTYNGVIMIFYHAADFDWSEIGLYDTFGL